MYVTYIYSMYVTRVTYIHSMYMYVTYIECMNVTRVTYIKCMHVTYILCHIHKMYVCDAVCGTALE